MEKLNRRKQIENLSSEQLAQLIIKSGYAFAYQVIINNDITGKKMLNMTWTEKEDMYSTMSIIQLTKFWLFVLSVQNNPMNFYQNLNNLEIQKEVIRDESAFPKKMLIPPTGPMRSDSYVLMVSRNEGEQRLKLCEPGSFFFRKSNKFHCVLMVKMDKQKIANIPVLKYDDGIQLLVINDEPTYFDNLLDLVTYHQIRQIAIKGEKVCLKYFIKKLK